MQLLAVAHDAYGDTWFIAKSVGPQKSGRMRDRIQFSKSGLFLPTKRVIKCSEQVVWKSFRRQ